MLLAVLGASSFGWTLLGHYPSYLPTVNTWLPHALLYFAAGMALAVLTVWAATVGAIIPIVLSKLKMDPAVVSAPFISSFVDGTGLIIYFTLARIFLDL